MASAVLVGCSVGPDYKPPQTAAPTNFSGASSEYSTNEPVAQWWRTFGDADLTRLMERAMSSNLDLRIATANLMQARALRMGAKADFYPVGTGVASYTNEKYSEAQVFNIPNAPLQQELYTAGFDATWELDIFGRLRRAYQSSTASMQALEANRRDVQVSLAGELARNYFELRGAQNELAVLRKNADNQTQTLKITQARLEAGGGTELDVARARA